MVIHILMPLTTWRRKNKMRMRMRKSQILIMLKTMLILTHPLPTTCLRFLNTLIVYTYLQLYHQISHLLIIILTDFYFDAVSSSFISKGSEPNHVSKNMRELSHHRTSDLGVGSGAYKVPCKCIFLQNWNPTLLHPMLCPFLNNYTT